MRKLKFIFVVLFFASTIAKAQSNSMFKALFIYNFTKNIEWPDSYNPSNFVIGIYGNSEIIEELNKISQRKKANNKTIVVEKFNTLQTISQVNILYIPITKSGQIKEILNHVKNKPILVITESPGLTQKGSCINFVLVKGDQKFEISKPNIYNQGLKVSDQLVELGISM